jgi:peptide/nickel transport system permease protein
VRAEIMSLRGRPFVHAARALGLGGGRILWRHLLPNAAGPIFVAATLSVAQVILIEAGLSYLGLGVPEGLPSWGSIIAEGRFYLRDAPWLAVAPGVALVGTVLTFARLSDRLQAAFNPAAR